MRPKVVLLILVLGVGAFALVGLLFATFKKEQAPPPAANGEVLPAGVTSALAGSQGGAATGVEANRISPAANPIIATTPEQDRAATNDKELEAISDALLAGEGDSNALGTIASRLEHPDAEVRAAAREAAVHFGNTNIIPSLASALESIKDLREKVAILDAIQYLQLPSGSEWQPLGAVGAVPGETNAPVLRLPRPRSTGTNGSGALQRQIRPLNSRTAAPATAPATAPAQKAP